jgi:hypothetical protein
MPENRDRPLNDQEHKLLDLLLKTNGGPVSYELLCAVMYGEDNYNRLINQVHRINRLTEYQISSKKGLYRVSRKENNCLQLGQQFRYGTVSPIQGSSREEDHQART